MNNSQNNFPIPKKQLWESKRWFIYALVVISIFVSFVFPSILFHNSLENKNGPTKIYFAANNSPAIKEIIERFNKKYEGSIEVELVVFNYEKFSTNKKKELITRTMRSMNGKIDIFSIDQIWVPRISKWSENLMKYFSEDDLSELVEPAFKTCIYKNTLCSMPLFLDLGIMYYRKDLLSKLNLTYDIEKKLKSGIEWNKLFELAEKIPSKYKYVFQGKNYEGLICNFFEFVGPDENSENNNFFNNVNNNNIVSKITFIKNLISKYNYIPKEALNFEEAGSFRYAIKNDVPFFRGWSTIYKLVKINSGDSSKINDLGIAALPKFQGNASVSTIGGWNLMLSKYSNSKKEAVKFIKFTLSDEIQKLLYTSGEYIPVIKNIYSDSLFVNSYPRLKFYAERLRKVTRRPFIEDYTLLSDILANNLHKSLSNKLSVKKAMDISQQEIMKILSNHKNH